jgi:hypothetical protein
MENYKFKISAAKNHLWFIDGSSKTEFREGSRYKKELKAYKDAGNELEPFETPEEIAARELKENDQGLDSQSQQCKNLLNETQHKVNGDYDYLATDVLKWKTWRAEIKSIMRSSTIQAIPEKPF